MSNKTMYWVFYDSISRRQSNLITTEDAQMAIFRMRHSDTERFFIWTAGWEKWQPLKAYLESKQKNFVTSFSTAEVETTTTEMRDALPMKPATHQVIEEVTASGVTSHTNTQTNFVSEITLDDETITNFDQAKESKSFDGDDLQLHNIEKPNVNFSKLASKLNKKATLDNRADRHDLKIEILFLSKKGKAFRSKSQNISLSGSLLEDNIPFDYSGLVFDVVVINKKATDPRLERVTLKAKTVGEGLTQRIYFVDMNPNQKMSLQKLLENYLVQSQSKLNKKTNRKAA